MSRAYTHSPDWTAREIAAVCNIPRYARAGYKMMPALRHRSKVAIARKRGLLREAALLSRGHTEQTND